MLDDESARPLPVQAPLTISDRPAARAAARLLVAGLLLGGCASSADVTGLASQDEVMRLRSEVTALQRSLQQTRSQTEALAAESRARDSSAESTRQLQAVNQRLDGITATLATLTKRIDDLTSRVETLGRQARPPARPLTGTAPPLPPSGTASPLVVAPPAPTPPFVFPPAPAPATTAAPTLAAPVPAPPARTATAGPVNAPPPPTPPPPLARPVNPAPVVTPPPPAAPPPPPPPAAAPPPPAPVASRSTTGVLQPQDLYQSAYIDFSKGSYALAIEGFREFLRRYPEHAQANSAQYWIGESYVALAQQSTNAGHPERAGESLQKAVQEFRKVVANYPRGDRAPTALYKEALTLIELKQPAVAQARLQYLVDNFPQAEEAPLARERLTALKQR